MADLLLRGATVVDGTGADRFRADVTVADGVITGVITAADTAPGRSAAARTIDADGLVLAPGFIDMHAHSDLRTLVERDHPSRVTQGVTCEVLGQDGLSYAPADDTTRPALRRQIAGWNGDPDDFDWNWRTVGEYLDRLDQGIAVNACYLVPHGSVRMLAMGWENREPSRAELNRMRELVAQGMREGAVGMSSGLSYTPGMYASTDELIELCEVVAAYGGYHSPHQRSYGAGALGGYAEMIEISRRSGCPLHLAHATMNFSVNAGRAAKFLELVDAALAEGCDISLDTYPYLPGSTTLAALLPSWSAEGGPDATLARLADPASRERIRRDVEDRGSDGNHGMVIDWRTIQISGVRDPALAGVVGQNVAQIAAARAVTGTEVFFDLLREDRLGTSILHHVGNEENVRAIMRHRTHTVGSDGLLVGARPHPRAWGTFPRYLGHYSRDLKVLTLEETVARMTGRPARRLRLDRRGLVRVGHHADLVLFDPRTVRDAATFEEPRRAAEGIVEVLVNGVSVVTDGRPTGALPGRALRRDEQGVSAL
ncbi:D-aminoacylase [Catenulispora sp. NL8]|uniref:D-aminoacylase n=1 Tax=Catenulispora pinistramenti TaxID=2705254 RepID=A0ABS5KKN6_9ACTN|nr:D-aminoacylase [Catenulispora pinistramenti]MBS2546599.1 D-aminoacylase [Catenulispora pinistramenti]